ncbi:MAG: efflux RND transporter periplasmic adaptor subunit [Saprospiraceae bacterium]|nr:efflux RND transporter periplasmic adaptor subunit [Saprospiraceae bacterium]
MLRIAILFIAFTLWGCSASPGSEAGELPEDLSELRKLQKDKQQQIKTLQAQLASIEARIREQDPTEVVRRLVTISAVSRRDFKRYAEIQGAVASKDLVSVSSETGGRIASVLVVEGEAVRRGQLIATIDLESLRKQRQELETQLQLARDIYERQARLWEQNIGSEVQYLQAKNNVERLEKSIETIDYQLTKEKLYAPLSGVVDMVNLKSGETAGPGVPIVMILDTRNIKVVADVPESYLGKVARGERVEVRFPALRDTLVAPVTMLGRKIDPANRTFKVEIDIPYNQGLYKPNLLAEVLINDYTEPDALVISQVLVQEEVGGKDYVMIVDDSEGTPKARKVYVTTGESYDGEVVITSGLEGSEQLIQEGARTVASGELIRIVEPQIATNDSE